MTDVTAVTAVDPAMASMLASAVQEDSQHGMSSVMDQIATVKVYNPAPGKPADPDKDGKFIITPANRGEPEVIEGPLNVTIFHVSYTYQGEIYFRDKTGKVHDNSNYVTSSEFGRYTKRSDVLSIASKGKLIGTYTKEDLERFIKTPMISINNNEAIRNPFYKEATDVNKKPYDSSALSKRVILYGQFNEGKYAGEKFRMFLSPSHISSGYDAENKVSLPNEEGMLEYAREQALEPLNQILVQNGYKKVREVAYNQFDVFINIQKNEKNNNLPKFEYVGLVAMRQYDNTKDVEFIRSLRADHHESMFGTDLTPAPINIVGQTVHVQLDVPEDSEPKAIPQTTRKADEFDVAEVFDEPTIAF